MDIGRETSSQDPIEELVFEALERIDGEGPGALEALCAEHPELAPALRARFEALARAGLIGAGEAARDLPSSFGEFEIERALGAGGMGVVYLARQPSLDRRVALKLVRPEHLYFPGARQRFQREVAAVARLSHPGVVAIHTVGEASGIPYFAMEAVEGASLAEVLTELRRRPPESLGGRDLYAALRACLERAGHRAPAAPEARAEVFAGSWTQAVTRLALDVAQALAHAHERGVLHRDVKPANVMLTAQGRVLLLDFGLASLSGSSRLTKTGSAMGSLPYMSPEQIAGAADVDARSDVWSVGVTYYELLTLQRPFDGKSDADIRSAIESAHPSSPRQLHSGLPWDPATVCLTALERDRDRRYPSAAALAADLRAILELRPISARRPGLARQLRSLVRRRPALATGLAFGLVSLVAGPLVYAGVERGARQRIEAANRATEEANVELARALGEARTQRDRAEHNFDQALEAVDTMLTKVGAERLANVPRMDEVRRELLESALAFQTSLLAQRAGDPALRLEAARAHGRVGTVQEQLGRIDEAVASQRAAVAVLEELATEQGEDELLFDLVAGYSRLGGAELRAADGTASRAAYERARDLLLGVGPEDARAADARTRLASIQYNLGVLHKRMGAFEPARAALEAALTLEQGSPRADPQASRASVATTLMELGHVALQMRDEALAVARFDQCHALLAELEPLAADDPAIANLIAKAGLDRGRLLNRVGRTDDAERDLAAALPRFERLARDYPAQTAYRIQLAATHVELAASAGARGDARRAEAGLRGALDVFAAIAEAAPEVADHRGNLGIFHERLADFLMGEGRYAEAAASYAQAQARHREGLAIQPRHGAIQKLLARARRGELAARVAARDGRALDLARALGRDGGADDLLASALALAQFSDVAGHDQEARAALARALEAGLGPGDLTAAQREALGRVPALAELLEQLAAPR